MRKRFVGTATIVNLSGDITATATSLTLASSTGWPTTGPFVVAVSYDTLNEEKILVASRTGNTLTITTRGYDGTTARAHASGVSVAHVLDADTVDEANDHVNTTTRDDHTQYARTDGTRAFTGTITATSAKVNLANNAYSAAEPITTYPDGLSVMLINTGGPSDWPHTIGLVETYRADINTNYRWSFQRFIIAGTTTPRVLTRNWNNASSTWNPWREYSDHGGLDGLADDDHTQYLRVDGTRASTGAQTFSQGVHPLFTPASPASSALLAAYPVAITYQIGTSADGSTWPGTGSVLVTTYKVDATSNRNYQVAVDANGSMFIRGWSTSAWTTWGQFQYADSVPWTAYTPTWTAATTNPALGNGTLTGRYTRQGKIVYFQLELVAGTTTTFGVGTWIFSVPVNISANFLGYIAQAQAIDDSSGAYYTLASRRRAAGTTDIPVAGGTNTFVNATAPFIWATGDSLRLTGWYEVV